MISIRNSSSYVLSHSYLQYTYSILLSDCCVIAKSLKIACDMSTNCVRKCVSIHSYDFVVYYDENMKALKKNTSNLTVFIYSEIHLYETLKVGTFLN